MSYSAWADNFLDVLSQTVTLAPYTGITGNGQKSYGTPHVYHAYVTADSKAVFTATGQTVFSTSMILFHPRAVDGAVLTAITSDALLTLPDGVTKPRLLTIGPYYDESGLVVCWEART
jgi:hypothetical protein